MAGEHRCTIGIDDIPTAPMRPGGFHGVIQMRSGLGAPSRSSIGRLIFEGPSER